ncbi:YcxB family protein [Wenyingzhuangia sp. IMCC45574]
MTIKYTIEEEDFLSYQFFFLSENKRFNLINKYMKYILSAVFVIQAISTFSRGDATLGGFFIFLATLCFLYLDKFYNKRIKKLLLKSIRQNSANRFGTKEELQFNADFLNFIYADGESKIETSALVEIVEIKTHFFIKIAQNQAYVLPKRELNNIDELKTNWQELGITLVDKSELSFV